MPSNIRVESSTVDSSDGVKLHCRVFKPLEGEASKDDLVIVLVHPYSVMGGTQAYMRGLASGLASNGYTAITFDMRGAGRSTGSSSLTGFSEVKDVVAVCKWASDHLSVNRILLVGSSAGIVFQIFILGFDFVSLDPFVLSEVVL